MIIRMIINFQRSYWKQLHLIMSYGITQYDIEKAIRDEKNTKYIESEFSVFGKEMLVKNEIFKYVSQTKIVSNQ